MRRAAIWLVLMAGLVLSSRAGVVSAGEIRVFAAASLKSALDDVGKEYSKLHGDTLSLTYAGSPVLARQIAAGAPAHVFVSANAAWMDVLEQSGVVTKRVDLLSNELVLIGSNSAADLKIAPGFALAKALGTRRLAMALVDAVPAGVYGREALVALGVWDSVNPRVVQADNVRAALRLVAIGAAPYGIVYRTDTLAEPRVILLDTFPSEIHTPIVYPAALLTGAPVSADAFWRHLTGPEARRIFLAHGFLPPGGAR